MSFPRNTSVWALDRFRSDALARFLDDLGPVGERGIAEDQCRQVRKALTEVIDAASHIPDGGVFRAAIWQKLQEYHDLYVVWNNISGSDQSSKAARSDVVKKIRACRNNIAKVARNNCYILDKELDIEVVDSMYKSFGKLCAAVPEVFGGLSKAVTRYFSRRA